MQHFSIFKKAFVIAFMMLFSGLSAQISYLSSFSPAAGNPGGLNTETDATTTGWISAGLPDPLSVNQWSVSNTLPFPFTYYGVPVTNFMVSGNGLLTFDMTATGVPANQNGADLPVAALPNNTIACYWDDFTSTPPTGSGDVVYTKTFGTAPNRQFWVKWFSYEWSNLSFVYISIVLEETTNKIYVVENYTTAGTISSTVGVQKDATTAVSAGNNITTNGLGTTVADNNYYTFSPISAVGDDVALTGITSPGAPICTGTQNVTVNIQNQAVATLTSAVIDWTLNGVPQPSYNWMGSLATNGVASVTLGTMSVVSGTAYTISATASMPNGNTDMNNANNSANKSFLPSLSGTYTINSALPTAGTNFASFNDFAAAANTSGVCGSVIVNVLTNQTEQVAFGAIPGMSAVNTVTINGNGNTLSFAPTTTNRHIIKFDGTDYFTVNNLNLTGTAVDFGWGVFLTNQADNITINNCVIDMTAVTSTTQSNSACIAASGSATTITTQGNNANNLMVSNCDLRGAYSSVVMMGISATPTSNNTFSSNVIRDFYSYGIYTLYNSGMEIKDNDIKRDNRATVTTFYGVYAGTGNVGMKIYRNKIHDTHNTATTQTGSANGIYITGADATAVTQNDVYNNLIYNFNSGSGAQYGVYSSSSDYNRIHHNTIVMNNAASTGGTVYAIYQTTVAVGVEIKNNIVYVNRGGTGLQLCLYYITSGSYIASDYNNLYYAGTAIPGRYVAADATTLAAWKAMNAGYFDQNSISTDPVFVNMAMADFTPTSPLMSNLGTASFVTNDYFLNPRNASTPDMGAIEYAVPGLDAAIGWVSPVAPIGLGSHPIIVNINNTQTTVITSISITYTNGTTPVTQLFTGLNLAGGANTNLTFTTPFNLTTGVTLTAFINTVNGISDNNLLNDTTSVQLCPAMSGTFTINSAGGADFTSFTSAVAAMNSCGISGPVTFNVAPGSGPYTEQVTIPQIAGMGASNPIVFNGNNATLQFTPNTNDRHIIWINGADYLTLNDLNVVGLATAFGYGIVINNQSNYCTIDGCTVNLSAVTSITSGASCGICATGSTTSAVTAGDNANHLTVQNCIVTGDANGGPYYGMTVIGSTGLSSDDNVISNNQIKDFYGYGLYLSNTSNSDVVANDISRPLRMTSTTIYALYSTGSSVNNVVTKNKVHTAFGGNTASTSSLYCYYNAADGTAGNSSLYANNTIYDVVSAGSQYGFYTTSVDFANYYHNSAVLDQGASTSNSVVYGMYFSAGSNINSLNNLVRINRGGTANKIGIYVGTTPTTFVSNHNDVYVTTITGGTNAHFGYFGSAARTTLANFQTASSQDANSSEADPMIIASGTGNLSPVNSAIDNMGTNLQTAVPTDINNVTRSTTPDPGAFEFCAVAATLASTNPNCIGSATGSASIAVTSGTAPITYLWSNGATTAGITGISAGSYTVTTSDALACSTTRNIILTEPTAITVTATATDITCNGLTNGTAEVAATGGISTYFYAWSNGATTMSVSGLSAGVYTVSVSNGGNCLPIMDTVTIVEPTVLSFNSMVSNVSCNGGNNGVINNSSTGANPPYTFSWSNGTTNEDATALTIGTYNVTATDAKGCTFSNSSTLTQPAAFVEVSMIATPVTCTGAANGTVTLVLSGGTAPYAYFWDSGATTANLSGLTAGDYSGYAFDANSCGVILSVATVAQVPGMNITTDAATNVSCNGSNNGSVSISVTGGTTPYAFSWSNGATTEDLTGIAAGSYVATVTDAGGCSLTVNNTISQPTAISSMATPTDVLCNGASTGSVDMSVSGGTAPYIYSWSNGATTEDLTGMAAGSYVATVTDAQGCSLTTNASISQSTAVSPTLQLTDILCNGASTGSVDMSVSGGNAPYMYLWSNGITTEDLTGIVAGNYMATITDAVGCSSTVTANIAQPAAISSVATPTNVSCNGGNNGSINMAVSGGTSPYTYLWNNNATTEDLTGLVLGNYEVTVTDANGCVNSSSITITEPSALFASMALVGQVSCFGNCDGSILGLTITGGNAPYSYIWNNGSADENLAGLCSGAYSRTVTDANGCTLVSNINISQPTALNITTSVTNATSSVSGTGDGAVNITVTGGVAAYTFVWSNGATTEDISGIDAGVYTVVVTDDNGCTATAQVTVGPPVGVNSPDNVTQLSIFPNPTSGELFVQLELVKPENVQLTVFDLTGKVILSKNVDSQQESRTQLDLSELPNGVYALRLNIGNQLITKQISVLK